MAADRRRLAAAAASDQILPTQIDVFYRTGAFGSLVSIASFGVAVWATSRLVLSMTGSTLGAVVGGTARAQPESALPACRRR